MVIVARLESGNSFFFLMVSAQYLCGRKKSLAEQALVLCADVVRIPLTNEWRLHDIKVFNIMLINIMMIEVIILSITDNTQMKHDLAGHPQNLYRHHPRLQMPTV